MKKILVFMFISLLFVSLVSAAQGSGNWSNQTDDSEDNETEIENDSENETEMEDDDENEDSTSGAVRGYCMESGYSYGNGTCKFKDNTTCDAEEFYKGECGQNKSIYPSEFQKQKGNEFGEITRERNRLRVNQNASECPNNCTCSGSTTKCWFGETREMTVRAGNSGNVIVQVKGENMSTNVTLYKAENGKVYRVTKNNETKEIKYLPDAVRERLREKIQAKIGNYTAELGEDGVYYVTAQKRAKFLGLFPVRERVTLQLNSETGEMTKLKEHSWWGFLASDEKEELIGASCGTVTPGQNDACCQNKGFATWNSETSQCEI